jgi:hypothetical protein
MELATGRNDEIDLLRRVSGENGQIDPHKLGLWLRRIEGRHVDGKRLFRDMSDKKRPKWVLDQVQA